MRARAGRAYVVYGPEGLLFQGRPLLVEAVEGAFVLARGLWHDADPQRLCTRDVRLVEIGESVLYEPERTALRKLREATP